MVSEHPDVAAGSSNRYQNWEVVDPEKWVPDGYVCVRVDSRGAGRSPGRLDPFSPRETSDLAACIEWAAAQPWSSGKVGLNGISYYAMNQWHVALASAARARGDVRMGGRLRLVPRRHAPRRDPLHVLRQLVRDAGHDRAERPGVARARSTRTPARPPAARRRSPTRSWPRAGPTSPPTWPLIALDDDYHRARSGDWERIDVPLLSAGNWGGHGLAPARERRGLRALGVVAEVARAARPRALDPLLHRLRCAAPEALLRALPQGRGHGLGRAAAGAAAGPARGRECSSSAASRSGRSPARSGRGCSWTPPASRSRPRPPRKAARSHTRRSATGITFLGAPLGRETEITGPSAAKLFVSSSTADADLFVVLRVFDPEGEEVTFQGAIDPQTPIAQGWLRASHRKLDASLSTAYRPYHAHDEKQELEPGETYELDVEIWPTSLVVPAGYRIALSVRGTRLRVPEGGRPAADDVPQRAPRLGPVPAR